MGADRATLFKFGTHSPTAGRNLKTPLIDVGILCAVQVPAGTSCRTLASASCFTSRPSIPRGAIGWRGGEPSSRGRLSAAATSRRSRTSVHLNAITFYCRIGRDCCYPGHVDVIRACLPRYWSSGGPLAFPSEAGSAGTAHPREAISRTPGTASSDVASLTVPRRAVGAVDCA